MLFQKKRPLIQIKNADEIEGMRRAGRLASQCLEHITKSVEPGMSTQDIDDLQMAFAKKQQQQPRRE